MRSESWYTSFCSSIDLRGWLVKRLRLKPGEVRGAHYQKPRFDSGVPLISADLESVHLHYGELVPDDLIDCSGL